MGLRELKAARTRAQIIDTALDLFLDQGYDETTMEQIAAKAEVGTTTLYRYFPSKDLLILARLEEAMDLGGALRERPAEEPVDVALGAAVRKCAQGVAGEDERDAALRRVIDNSPVPRAMLWDLGARYAGDLKAAIAERTHRPADDLQVVMTAHIAYAVLQVAADAWQEAGGDHAARAAAIDGLLHRLNTLDLVLPAPPAGTGTGTDADGRVRTASGA
ncbi:TetR/AcrR family transcriptional regulator [Streptomyces sp. NBC_01515]|uniref:TetR/AcrR family transcriptional regulator n=1 Tax=Streptomyces sp. NBC_01515 TaxID=2903890 RepID=UPI003870B24C